MERGERIQMMFDYHYGAEAEQYAFFRIPKRLISDPYFRKLSTDAKLLYGLMLDRMSLSAKNGWMDDNNRVYIYFTIDDICEYLCCSHEKAVKLLAELDTKKGYGLIERQKQGQGKPTKIYVKRFIQTVDVSVFPKTKSADFGKSEVKTSGNRNSRLRMIGEPDFGKSEGNNTEINENEYNDMELSIYPSVSQMDLIDGCRKQVKTGISYDFLMQQYPHSNEIGEMVELIVEVLCTQEEFVRIGRKQVYTSLVKERLRQLDYTHIEYILECMKESPAKIKNIKAYLLEALFNAPITIDNYHKAKVNYDFFGSG